MQSPIYSVVFHSIRIRLGLSLNEYCVADSIHKLSHNPNFPWCVQTREKLGEFLGISKRSIIEMVKRLDEKGIVEIHPETGHTRTTEKWINAVELSGEESSPEPVKKVHQAGEESSPNNNTNKNIDNTVTKVTGELAKTDPRNPEIQSLWEYGLEVGFTDTKQQYQRYALKRLTTKHTAEQLRTAAKFAASIKFDRYAPQVNSWIDLEEKYLKLRDYVARKQQSQRKIVKL